MPRWLFKILLKVFLLIQYIWNHSVFVPNSFLKIDENHFFLRFGDKEASTKIFHKSIFSSLVDSSSVPKIISKDSIFADISFPFMIWLVKVLKLHQNIEPFSKRKLNGNFRLLIGNSLFIQERQGFFSAMNYIINTTHKPYIIKARNGS